MSSDESSRLLRRLAVGQFIALILWGGVLVVIAPGAWIDGVAGGLVMAVAIVASGAYALGGGVLGGERAAFRAVASIVGRWLLAGIGLVLLAARDGAVVWAVACGAVVAQAAYLAAAATFKRV